MGLFVYDGRVRTGWIILGVIVSFILLYPIQHNRDWLVVLHKAFFINGALEYNCWPDQLIKALEPFRNLPCPPEYLGCHAGNMAFRFTIPVFLHIFGLNGQLVYLFQLFLGVFFLYGVYKLSFSIGKNQILAVGFLLCFISTNAGQAIVYEFRALGDGFAFIFLLFSVLTKRNILQFLFLQLAFWTDERALVASLGMALYWLCLSDERALRDFGSWVSIRDFLFKNKQVITLIISYVAYFAVRQYLTLYVGLKTPKEDANFGIMANHATIKTAIPIILTHKFFLIYMIIGGAYLVRIRAWLVLAAYIGFIIVYHLVAHMVFDTSRSMGYGYFIYFIAFNFACRYLSEDTSRKLMLASVIGTIFIFPLRHILF